MGRAGGWLAVVPLGWTGFKLWLSITGAMLWIAGGWRRWQSKTHLYLTTWHLNDNCDWQLHAFIFQESESLEEAFAGYIVKNDKLKRDCTLHKLKKFWQAIPQVINDKKNQSDPHPTRNYTHFLLPKEYKLSLMIYILFVFYKQKILH